MLRFPGQIGSATLVVLALAESASGFAVASAVELAKPGAVKPRSTLLTTELSVMRGLNLGQFGRRYGYYARGPVLLAKSVPGRDENTPREPVVVPVITEATDPESLGLVPYSQAKLRISMFPMGER